MSSVLDRPGLEQSPLADLHLLAGELGVENFRRLRKAELGDAILARQSGEEPTAAAAPAGGGGPPPPPPPPPRGPLLPQGRPPTQRRPPTLRRPPTPRWPPAPTV